MRHGLRHQYGGQPKDRIHDADVPRNACEEGRLFIPEDIQRGAKHGCRKHAVGTWRRETEQELERQFIRMLYPLRST